MKKKKKATSPRRKKASEDSPQLKWGRGQVWPLERDILFRPDRFKYVRKLVKTEGCVFCLAASKASSFETLCVFQSTFSMVVLNKFPYNSGHLLVLPRRHCGDLQKLSAEESTDLWRVLNLTMEVLQSVYQPGGLNVGLNHGAVAGAGIPDHLHFHVIPRWAGDLNFFPLIAETKVVVESLEQSWDRLKIAFQEKEKSQ